MHLEELHKEYLEKVVSPLLSEEYRREGDLDTSVWTDETFGFFYCLGKRNGYLVETNCGIVERFDPDRYLEHMEVYRKPPKEYLVDLCWRNWDKSTGCYRLELALELEWRPHAPGGYGDEDMDEDVYKLLDVDARKRVGVLGCAAREKKHLSRDSVENLISNFRGYAEARDFNDAEFLLIFFDNDDTMDYFGVGASLIDTMGGRTDLPGYPYAEFG